MARKRAARKRGSKASSSSTAAKKRAAKKRPAKKRAAKKSPAKKQAARKSPAKKSTARKSPAKSRARKGTSAGGKKLLTLTEVSKRTGISMPTLQRYKKEYQNRLETVGEGRTQRYTIASLDTFKEIKKENLKKRGRPRKAASAGSDSAGAAKSRKSRQAGKSAADSKAAPAGLISLSEIGRRTGISYPTLLRYVRLHGDRIPSHGTGRKRRFPERAVPVFSQLRKESRRGRRKGSPAKKAAAGKGLEARMQRMEKSQAALEKQIGKLIKALKRPLVKGI